MAPPAMPRSLVLIVDDEDRSRKLIQTLVQALGHDAETARDWLEALAKLRLRPDLVLLDIVMPDLDGFELCRRIRLDPYGVDLPVMMVTSLASKEDRLRAVEAGANDFIAKPVDQLELRVRAASLLKMKAARDAVKRSQAGLTKLVVDRTASLREALEEVSQAHRLAYREQIDAVERLAVVAEYKDSVTGKHLERMSRYCGVIARALGLPPGEVELLEHGSRLHDVGKIGVPDAILQKPGPLDAAEWEVMRRHPTIGAQILSNSRSEILQTGRVIALTHHERWDGTGYPAGLAGDAIPLFGRISAVADVYDALTSARPYKPAYSRNDALAILRRGRGTHFAPPVLDAFFGHLDEILNIQATHRDLANAVPSVLPAGRGQRSVA